MNVAISVPPSPLSGTVTINVTLTPPSQVSGVTRIEYWIDSALKSTDSTGPFYTSSYSWDTTTTGDGTRNITVKAFYPRNKKAENQVTVTVLNVPTPPSLPPPQGVPINTTAPAINDLTPDEGQTINVNQGAWTNSPTSYRYQWLRCDGAGASCQPIPSATNPSYTTSSLDAGSTLRCAVTAINGVGASAPQDSAATAAVAGVASAVPVLIAGGEPNLWGTTVLGNTLSSGNGSWTNNPTSYAYQWTRCAGAVSSINNGDTVVSGQIWTVNPDPSFVKVEFWVDGAQAKVDDSAPYQHTLVLVNGAHALGIVLVDGAVPPNRYVQTGPGLTTGFYANITVSAGPAVSTGALCADISGATTANYVLTSADVGQTLRCEVIASNATGPAVAPGISNATSRVTSPTPDPPPPPPSGNRVVYTLGDPNWNPTGTPGWWFSTNSSTGWQRDAAGQNTQLGPLRVYFDNDPVNQVMGSVTGSYGGNVSPGIGSTGPCRTVACRIDGSDPQVPNIVAGAQAAHLRPVSDAYNHPDDFYGMNGLSPTPQQGETWWYGYAVKTNAGYKAHGQDVADLAFGMWNLFGLDFHWSGAFGLLGPLQPEIHTIRPASVTSYGSNGGVWWTCNSPGAFSHLSPPRLGVSLTAGVGDNTTDDATHTCRRMQGPVFTAGTLYKIIYQVKWDAFQQGIFRWWVKTPSDSAYLQYADMTSVSTLWRTTSGQVDPATFPSIGMYRKTDTSLPTCITYQGGWIKGTTMADVMIP